MHDDLEDELDESEKLIGGDDSLLADEDEDEHDKEDKEIDPLTDGFTPVDEDPEF